MTKIPVLFVHSRSNYKKIAQFDCYDEQRNALNYTGLKPVIAHPPCRLWSKLRSFSNAPIAEKSLAVWSVKLVRKVGGIVEHPYDSQLWKEINSPVVGKFDKFGGTSFVFDQFDFGFYTRKRTRIYIVGLNSLSELPRPPIRFETVTRKFENLSTKQRSETTTQLCMWFLEIILKIEENKLLK